MPLFSFDWSWQGVKRQKAVRVTVPGTVGEYAPLVVLLHGTGGTVEDMAEPAIHPGFNVQRVAEGAVVDRGWHGLPPLGWWSAGMDDLIAVEGWEPYLYNRGVPTINYTQAAAKGSLAESAAELRRLLELFEEQRVGQRHPAFAGVSHRRIVLMGHSRGGVLARQVLVDLRRADAPVLRRISTCITLHAPNQGSNIANVAITVDAVASDWKALIDQQPVAPVWKWALGRAVDKFFGFVHEEAGAAVFPDYAVGSPVLAALAAAEPVPGIRYFTFGGTRSSLFNLRAWPFTVDSYVPRSNNPPFHWRTTYQKILAVPPPLPHNGPLPELTPGAGDACVAAAATRLPFSTHRDNNISHAEALWDAALKGQVAAIVDGLSSSAAAGPTAVTTTSTLELPLQLRSLNFPDRFIRHRNFLGELTGKEGPPEDFLFTIVRRGEGRIALRSVNYPAAFLRHRDFRIRLEAPEVGGETLFEQDTTFALEPGLADPNNPQSISLRSVNYPDRYLRHRDYSLYLEPKSSPNLAADATFSKVEVPMQLRSFNFRDRFIRHRNYVGELTPTDPTSGDFLFTVVPRGEGRVALRSVNFPDLCLRHREFRIWLEGPTGPDDTLFAADSTFQLERGLMDPNNPQSVSFRSVNYPDRYLRHRNYMLYLEPRNSANLAADGTFYTVPVPLPAGSQMTVPNVVGLRRTDAEERIRAAQLQARFTGAVDPVVAQTPAGGGKAPPGSAVTVELTIAETTVPPVEGLRRPDAEERLRLAGLGSSVTGSTDPAGWVITQSPVSGTKVTSGTRVSLTVEVRGTTVPHVIGLSPADADSRIRAAQLQPSFSGSTTLPASVSAQSPAGDTKAQIGSLVHAELVSPPATVPDVIGFARRAAETTIIEAGLVPRATSAGEWVTRQSPVAGTSVERGTPVSFALMVGEPL